MKDEILLHFEDNQESLYKVLILKNNELGSIYISALYILKDLKNPDRFALAAHNIRELMEKIPEYYDVPFIEHKKSLKNKVNDLQDQWNQIKRSSAYTGQSWEGTIDHILINFLGKLSIFFEWYSLNYPRRTEEIRRFLRIFDPMAEVMPPLAEKIKIERWRKLRDEFFIPVAHHRKKTDENVFMQNMNDLELFLLERFLPDTTNDLDLIDTLIEEDENNT